MAVTKTKVSAVPARTVERLVVYRTLLEGLQVRGKTNIFSNELAQIAGSTPTQVRRDLMVVGYTGNSRNGYRVDDLLKAIRSLLETPGGLTMAIAGIGNLGRALLGYFSLLHPRFKIVAAFDNDENKVGRTISGCRIRQVREMSSELEKASVQIGVITVPADQAQKAADAFVAAKVKGIVNFAAVPLSVPADVWLEDMHITSTLEKVAYFSRMTQQGESK